MSTTVTYDASGSFTWTCPLGVSYVSIECWGAGGGGGFGGSSPVVMRGDSVS